VYRLEQQLSLEKYWSAIELKPRLTGVTLTVTESESLDLHLLAAHQSPEKPVPGTNSMALAERRPSYFSNKISEQVF